MERVWGGRSLESFYGKCLPPVVPIGESWEIVDRPEAQSTVLGGPIRGMSLHELWINHRAEIFGDVADAPRFPILLKLLDAQEKLSLQVHPPPAIAAELKGEPKTEWWYIADATPAADIYVGLRKDSTRAAFAQAIADGTVEEHCHRIAVQTGDAIFLPSGRLHALGAGNLIVEVQQNSDTTYRVYDWGRAGTRKMHVAEALQCIDFEDRAPSLLPPEGESLVRHELFDVQKWALTHSRELVPPGQFAIGVCLSGVVECAGERFRAGEFFLVPAQLPDRAVRPGGEDVVLLRIIIPPR